MLINTEYEILNSSGEFVDFFGIENKIKFGGIKVTLEDDNNIVVSKDHIFLVNDLNVHVSDLIPNLSYLTTKFGDKFVKKIELVDESDFYDIIDSENCDYYANDISNHNCSFLGSGDNFIDEKFLNRIELKEVMTPIREEYGNNQMHIFQDPIEGENYLMAIDVSSGHGDDNSSINILKYNEFIEIKNIVKQGVLKKVKIKNSKFEQVAEFLGKITPQQLGQLAYQYGLKYNYAYCVVDVTGGIGNQTVSTLIDLGYENMHYAEIKHKPTREMLGGYIKQSQRQNPDGTYSTVDLIPGFFIGGNRGSVLQEFQRSINMGDIIIRSDRTLNELKTFVTVKGARVADHRRTYHDDSIMGIAIGIYTLNFDMYKFNVKKDNSKKLLDAMARLNNPNTENAKPIRNTIPANHQQSQYGWLYKGLNGRR